MRKVTVTKKQNNAIQTLLKTAKERGSSLEYAKERLLRIHVTTGWQEVKDSTYHILDELSVEDFATVLYSDNYEVEDNLLCLQEYEVTLKINRSTTITNKVVKENMEELSKGQITRFAIQNLKSVMELKGDVKLTDDNVVSIHTIKLE